MPSLISVGSVRPINKVKAINQKGVCRFCRIDLIKMLKSKEIYLNSLQMYAF